MFAIFSFPHLDYCHLDSADKALTTNHLRHKSKVSPGKVNFWKWSNRVVNHYWREMSNASFDNSFVIIWQYKVFPGYLQHVSICGTDANAKAKSFPHLWEVFLLFVIIKAPGGRTAGSAYWPCSFHKPNTEFFVIIFQLNPTFPSLGVLQKTEDIST